MLNTASIRDAVTATRVADRDRLRTLPKFFGRHMLRIEGLVYTWMGKLSTEYVGGFWEFYELSNGGFYMAPREGTFAIVVFGNQYSGRLSADAAGIVACLFAIGTLMNTTIESRFVELYHNLRAFAAEHAEGAQILAAID